mmetsp:Transcript_6860/g.14874  ORF Transcript_6860/g.14874 Transcript_6860/m.14874 type:complete len:300 (-) Transcript_6860:334-1233(-)
MALLGRPQGAKRRHHQRGLLAKATPVLVLACLTLVLLQASDAFVAVSPAGGHAGRVGSMRAWQSAPAAIAAVGQPRELASYGSLAAILCTAVALAARHSHCRGIAAAAAPRRAVLCLRADLPGTTDAPCSERAITEVAPSSVAVQLPAASSGIEALSALPPPAPKQAPAEPVYATVAAAATAPSATASPRRCLSARFVGRARLGAARPARQSSGAQASERSTRRRCGSRLQDLPAIQPRTETFDSSRLRTKIQTGLCVAPYLRHSSSKRESRTAPSCKGTSTSDDSGIQAKDGERFQQS